MKVSKEQRTILKRAGWLGKTIPIIEDALYFEKLERDQFWLRLYELLDRPAVAVETMSLDQKIAVAEAVIDRFKIPTNKCRHVLNRTPKQVGLSNAFPC